MSRARKRSSRATKENVPCEIKEDDEYQWIPFVDRRICIRDRLAKELGGKIEVACNMGYVAYIDIVTEHYLIDVKRCSDWTQGFGQLLMYGQEYPQSFLDILEIRE
jgi:hypothetical protein